MPPPIHWADRHQAIPETKLAMVDQWPLPKTIMLWSTLLQYQVPQSDQTYSPCMPKGMKATNQKVLLVCAESDHIAKDDSYIDGAPTASKYHFVPQ